MKLRRKPCSMTSHAGSRSAGQQHLLDVLAVLRAHAHTYAHTGQSGGHADASANVLVATVSRLCGVWRHILRSQSHWEHAWTGGGAITAQRRSVPVAPWWRSGETMTISVVCSPSPLHTRVYDPHQGRELAAGSG